MRSPLMPPIGFGPGSQPDPEDGAELNYLQMPSSMASFEPRIPWGADQGALEAGLPFLRQLRDMAHGWQKGETANLDIDRIAPAGRSLVDETLGEGEVSIVIDSTPRIEIQESVFAGIWRVRRRNGEGEIVADRVEVATVPAAVLARTFPRNSGGRRVDAALFGPGVVNASSILTEIAFECETRAPDADAHIINLTLLPHTPEDLHCIETVLGDGPTRILSRGYGNCRIDATAWPRVWRVRYYNSMDTLILDTIEVVAVPLVALAAEEDIRDSATRFDEVLEALA